MSVALWPKVRKFSGKLPVFRELNLKGVPGLSLRKLLFGERFIILRPNHLFLVIKRTHFVTVKAQALTHAQVAFSIFLTRLNKLEIY